MALWVTILNFFAMISAIIYASWFFIIGIKVSYEFKTRYIKALLNQESDWFDAKDINLLPTQVYQNLQAIEAAVGIRLGFLVFTIWAWLASLIGSFCISLYLGAAFSFLMVYVILIAIRDFSTRSLTDKKLKEAYAQGGADAHQAISNIKIVKAFGNESYESQKFESHLKDNEAGIKSQSWTHGTNFVTSIFVIILPFRHLLSQYSLFAITTD